MERQLTIVVAGLYGPQLCVADAVPDLSLPQFETLLARATRIGTEPRVATQQSDPRMSFDALLYRLFDVHIPCDADLPVAATTRFADSGVSDNHWWICADPVHLQPQGSGLIMRGNELLDLSQDEAERLVAELLEVFGADGWLLEAARPNRWYLRPATPARILTHSVDDLLGQDIRDYLPSGPDAKAWHILLNEAQILLHSSVLNAERERHERPAVNSLWFWGGGALPSVKSSAWTQVWSDEPLSRGLARLGGAGARAVPVNATRWLQAADVPGTQLLVLDQARIAAQRGDWSAWQRFIEWFEELWLAPLLEAVRARELTSLTLYTEHAAGMRLTRRDLGRWWRRRRRLSAYRRGDGCGPSGW